MGQFRRLVINCSASSDMGASPLPDPMNLRHNNMSSMAPFGMQINEKPSYKWRRVLLKVSGEALAGDHSQNIDPKVTMAIAREVASVTRLGIEASLKPLLSLYVRRPFLSPLTLFLNLIVVA